MSTGLAFDPLARASVQPLVADRLSDRLAARLIAQIEHGALQPGDRLPTEAQLGAVHGVSRSVVREARRLRHRVATGAGRGTLVSRRDQIEVYDAVFRRFFLGGAAEPDQAKPFSVKNRAEPGRLVIRVRDHRQDRSPYRRDANAPHPCHDFTAHGDSSIGRRPLVAAQPACPWTWAQWSLQHLRPGWLLR